MNSSVVPGCSRTTAHRASSSSRLAWRDGTGAPVWSLWLVDHVEEKPRPPAVSPSWSSDAIRATSSGVASRSVAAGPMTTRRMAEWPTRKPALGVIVPSRRSR